MKLNKTLNLLAVFVLISAVANAQQTVDKEFTAKKIDTPPTIDGVLDEAIWKEAQVLTNFSQYFPSDSEIAEHQTYIQAAYTDTHLYISIKAENPDNNFVASTLKRDFFGTQSDNVSFLIDTFNDGTNGFQFSISPFGVRREALIFNGGSRRDSFNRTWDTKWKGESKIYDTYFTAEMEIPFNSIKFKENSTSWRFRAYRFNIATNEQSVSNRIPQNLIQADLGIMGKLNFEEPLGKSKTPINLIPYINALTENDFVGKETNGSFKFGGDAKIAVGSGLNLDLTFNPDFSNVEVDRVFTNLSRFEFRLPELRQFFIDNGDLFGNLGSGRDDTPFFSRRIGLAYDKDNNLIENRILAGARLSGKINEDWRLGFLSIQTAEDPENEIASFNNTMLVLQKKVFARSNINIFAINRQTLKDYDFLDRSKEYNRVFGVDYQLASADTKWQGNFYAHKSLQPDDYEGNISARAQLSFNTREWRISNDFVYVDKEYRSDLGFVPRTGIIKNGNFITRNFYPKAGKIQKYQLQSFHSRYWQPELDNLFTDRFLRTSFETTFRSNARVEIGHEYNYTFLTSPFDPTRTSGATPLPADVGYHYNKARLEYESNQGTTLFGQFQLEAGTFYTGNVYSLQGRLGYRFQPWVELNFGVNYDAIRLPDPYESADIWLLSPRVDVTFTKSLFWTTIFQYSNQRDNLGINSRLQWRFAPLSDLYLVYNDNYFVNVFSPKYRSLNLKVTYRFGL
jgi:hypothetical protein